MPWSCGGHPIYDFAHDHTSVHLAGPVHEPDLSKAKTRIEAHEMNSWFSCIQGKLTIGVLRRPCFAGVEQCPADSIPLKARLDSELARRRHIWASEVFAHANALWRLGNDGARQLTSPLSHKALTSCQTISGRLRRLIDSGVIQPLPPERCISSVQQCSK